VQKISLFPEIFTTTLCPSGVFTAGSLNKEFLRETPMKNTLKLSNSKAEGFFAHVGIPNAFASQHLPS